MNNTDFFNYLKRGESLLLTGPSGSGKTTLLVSLYKNLIDNGYDSVYIPSPTRMSKCKILSPKLSYILNKSFIEDIFAEYLYKENEHSSGQELFQILHNLSLNGKIREKSILLIDEVEASFYPKALPKLVNLLNILKGNYLLNYVLTSSSIFLLRAVDEKIDDMHYVLMKDGVGELCDTNKEKIYREFFSVLEEL